MSSLSSDSVAPCPDVFWGDTATHFCRTDWVHPMEWLEALRTNDVETATTILQSASAKYKDFLMNGDIPTFDGDQELYRRPIPGCSSMKFCITKPWHAAAIFHSHAVLQLLWSSGVDVLQVDRWKNNVIHMLIYADSTENSHGTSYVNTLTYLQGLLSKRELTSLLSAENAVLLRPLEFAALHGCLEMAGAIMGTKGIYLLKEKHVGYSCEQYFDLSDYESFDKGMPPRFFRSPLNFLIFTETSRIDVTGSDRLFDDPGLKSWIYAKIVTNGPFVFIWFLLRLCYISLFFSASLEGSWPTIVSNSSSYNATNTDEMVVCSSEKSALGSFRWYTLASIAIVILIYDFSHYLCMRKLIPREIVKLLGGRDFSAHVYFYYTTQLGTCVSILGISTCQILRSAGLVVPQTLDHIFFFIASWGSIWGVVYFLQVLPWISLYAIAVQRMLQEFTRFTLIFVIFLSAFALSFRRILLGDSNECPKMFSTFRETFYTSFLVMINSVNFREFKNVDKTSLYLLHILFVFFISILLLNFLIATMTQSFSGLHAKGNAIIQTQRLALMMTVQMRLAWPMQFLYRIMQRRVFVYHNKRLCLRRTLITKKNVSPIPWNVNNFIK